MRVSQCAQVSPILLIIPVHMYIFYLIYILLMQGLLVSCSYILNYYTEIVTSLVEIPAAGSSGGGKHDAGNFQDNTRRPQSLPRGNVAVAVGGIANHAQAASNPAQGAHYLPPIDTQVPAHPTHPQATIAPFSHILATV